MYSCPQNEHNDFIHQLHWCDRTMTLNRYFTHLCDSRIVSKGMSER